MASNEIYQNLKRCIVNLKISRSTKNTKVDYYQLLEKGILWRVHFLIYIDNFRTIYLLYKWMVGNMRLSPEIISVYFFKKEFLCNWYVIKHHIINNCKVIWYSVRFHNLKWDKLKKNCNIQHFMHAWIIHYEDLLDTFIKPCVIMMWLFGYFFPWRGTNAVCAKSYTYKH